MKLLPNRLRRQLAKELSVVPGKLAEVPEAPAVGNIRHQGSRWAAQQFFSHRGELSSLQVCLGAYPEAFVESPAQRAQGNVIVAANVTDGNVFILMIVDVSQGLCKCAGSKPGGASFGYRGIVFHCPKQAYDQCILAG
mgnify:CR=1 FL=1